MAGCARKGGEQEKKVNNYPKLFFCVKRARTAFRNCNRSTEGREENNGGKGRVKEEEGKGGVRK